MPRIDLTVPFTEKDEAKRLGARWDSERKVWYVPDGIDASNFERWLPKEPDINVRSSSYLIARIIMSNINVRSSSYFIAQTITSCWKCKKSTSAHGFILPAGYEVLESDEEEEFDEKEDADYVWRRHDYPTIIHYVTDLLPTVAARIKTFSRHYNIAFSKTTQSSYWMNHCEHCGMRQGDFMMYCKPGGGLCPVNERAASLIVLHEFAEPFSCNGDGVYGDPFFEYMRRA